MRTAAVPLIWMGLLLTGCGAPIALEGPPADLQAAVREALATGEPAPALQEKPLAVGPEAPYIPVILPPEVRRVWVPDHLTEEGDLVSGHWVYLQLAPSRWFLEAYPPTGLPTLRVPAAPGGALERPKAEGSRATREPTSEVRGQRP